MPRNGAGVMEIEFPDFTPSTTILSSEVDQNNEDIADEITNSLPRDGQAGMNGQFKAADGTVSAPAISFTLDTNCGAYRIGADNIGFAIGGAKVLDLSAGSVGVSAGVAFTGAITPSQIAANQDNYAPTGHAATFVFRVSSDAARDITGLDGGADGRVVRFRNVGTSDITFKDESASSTAANRFALSGDFTLLPDESADLQYDPTLTRWTLASTSFNLGGVPTETAPATNDQLLIRDTSAGAPRRMTFANALKVVNALTSETAVAADDQLALYDTSASTVDKVSAGLMNAFGLQLLHVRDEKAVNTGGGAFTTGDWRTRTLNTVMTNEITGASLASNEITLPSGTYWVTAHCPGHRVENHKARLRNITAGATLLSGASEKVGAVGFSTTRTFVSGRITISTASAIALEHRCSTTGTFGEPSNFAEVEVYAEVMVWKIA